MKQSRASRQLALAASIAAMAITVAACGDHSKSGSGGSASGGSGSAKVTKLSFQTFPQTMGTIPIKVAQEQGIFKKNGLDVSVSDGTAGPTMVSALAAGKVDAVGIPMFVGMQSVLAGAKIKALVGLIGGGGSVVFASDRVPQSDTPYPASAKALDGKTAAISAPGGFSEKLLKRYVDGAGASLKYATLPGVAPEIAAMKAGKVDVVNFDLASSYPFVKQGVGHVFWDFQTTGPDELRGATTNEVWVSDDFLAKNPDAAKAFARSIAQADAWIADPANRAQIGKYFSAIAGGQVADGDLDPMIEAVKPAVGEKDVEVYNGFLDKGAGPLTASALLAPMAPQDETAAKQLAEES
jgi:NitT/TauT family transport system substrate-binding protein